VLTLRHQSNNLPNNFCIEFVASKIHFLSADKVVGKQLNYDLTSCSAAEIVVVDLDVTDAGVSAQLITEQTQRFHSSTSHHNVSRI